MRTAVVVAAVGIFYVLLTVGAAEESETQKKSKSDYLKTCVEGYSVVKLGDIDYLNPDLSKWTSFERGCLDACGLEFFGAIDHDGKVYESSFSEGSKTLPLFKQCQTKLGKVNNCYIMECVNDEKARSP